MAGLPNYSDNPIQSGNVGQAGDKSMEVALAAKMALILDQPMADVSTGLTNRDFEGEFFKIGDTVAIVKPDISSLNIQFGDIGDNASTVLAEEADDEGKPLIGGDGAYAANRYRNKDARLRPTNVTFNKTTMTINKYVKYAFYISDFTEAEGKWNYESGNLDAVAQEIRKEHNRRTLNAILKATETPSPVAGATVPVLGADTALDGSDGDKIYQNVIVPIFAKLYNAGAITADGQITYGSNAQEGKSTAGCIYVPTSIYTSLLTSHYLQDRSTVAADEKVKTGKVKTIMGLDIAIEPSLDVNDENIKRKVDMPSGAPEGSVAVIAGTRNLVTRAGKVLPPEKLRSHKFFADEYHGCELYAEEVVTAEAGVVAFVSLGE